MAVRIDVRDRLTLSQRLHMHECPLYSDPELYDSLFPGGDEERRKRTLASEQFYIEEARRSGGRVLELACGSGRLTIPIAQQGIEITGVDVSKSMLETARAKAREARVEIEFVEADMRSFELPGKFTAILIPGNSLLHLLTFDDLKQCLAGVRRHLETKGRLIFDISKWDLGVLRRAYRLPEPALKVNDPKRGEVTIEEVSSYNAVEQIRHFHWSFSAAGTPDFRKMDYQLRVIFPQELLLLLDTAGFRLEERYGEFPRQAFRSDSPRQICICSVSGP